MPLVGGLGDDIYMVRNLTDVVTEAAASGNDTVIVTLTGYTNVANIVRRDPHRLRFGRQYTLRLQARLHPHRRLLR